MLPAIIHSCTRFRGLYPRDIKRFSKYFRFIEIQIQYHEVPVNKKKMLM